VLTAGCQISSQLPQFSDQARTAVELLCRTMPTTIGIVGKPSSLPSTSFKVFPCQLAEREDLRPGRNRRMCRDSIWRRVQIGVE
jgi:hypothetical protein